MNKVPRAVPKTSPGAGTLRRILASIGALSSLLCVCLLGRSACVLAITLGLASLPAQARELFRAPRVDTFDRFDVEQSPLQKGLLDARDTKWRRNIKLGPDPRCSRVIREIGHGKPRIKLCDDHGWDQETCLQQYCCERPPTPPVGGGGCTAPGDAEILACAHALIEGGDTSVCIPGAPVSPAPDAPVCRDEPLESFVAAPLGGDRPPLAYSILPSAPPEPWAPLAEAARTKACLDEIFVNNRGNRAADCLEDPDRDGDGTIDAKCRPIFEACDDMPVATARRTHQSSGPKAKRVHTTTQIHYERPARMKTPPSPADEAWDPLQMRGASTQDEDFGVPGGPRPVNTLHGAASWNPRGVQDCDPLYRCLENDDGDCVDRASGAHRTDCFEGDGRLKATLEWISQDPGDLRCRHIETGEQFEGEDECLGDDGTLATTLVQQIDEDPADSLNKDGDCKLAGTPNENLRSDCLGPDGRLLPGYAWNVGEELCDGMNDDGDCLAIDGEQTGPARGRGSIGLLRAADDTCVMADGRVFARPQFRELADEDCAAALDNDGDNLVDEDPAGVRTAAPDHALYSADDPTLEEERCAGLYARYGLSPEPGELPDADHGCDLDRLMRVHVNRELERSPLRESFRVKSGVDRFFDVDSTGHWCVDGAPDPPPGCRSGDARGAVNGTRPHDPQNGRYRFEERRALVDEAFAVKCKPARVDSDGDGAKDAWVDTVYDEASGTCVTEGSEESTAVAAVAEDSRCLAPDPPPECRQAMMGFTFAPPVLEWGWRVRWRVCIFGICFEIFYARIGYEFDLATGVRLPVEIDFENLPQRALASDGHAFDGAVTSLAPKDFSVEEFRNFCRLHRLDAPWYISDCDRFAFPDFLDASDGDEFVAHYAVFAGLIVRVFSIPLVNWGIESAVDIPGMCTTWKMKDGIEGLSFEDLVKIQLGLLEGSDALAALKDNLGNCGSFTTPFGMEECPPWECSTGWRLRGWPFLSLEKHIRADCLSALLHDEVVTIKGQKRPICTGMILGYQGASLGIGLIIEANAGSRLIDAEQTAGGDACTSGPPPHPLQYTRAANEPDSRVPLYPVTADNFSAAHEIAWLGIDDFTYYLNAIEIALSANLEFGGILEPIPDIGSFLLYNFVFDTGQFGIPIPQHPGTAAVSAAVPVDNYGLVLDVRAPEGAPSRVDDKTVAVPPGQFGSYDVRITNLGSVPGSFDNLACELSNRAYPAGIPSSEVLVFRIDPNTDHDCTGPDGTGHWFGDPYDGQPDDCYDAAGEPRPDRVEAIDEDPPGPAGETVAVRDEDHDGIPDEDPPDEWRVQPAGFPGTVIGPLPAHETSQPFALSVSPFRHPLTRPGIYALRVTADCHEAVEIGLPDVDPLGFRRIQSTCLRGSPETWTGPEANPHVAFIAVESFFDPQVLIDPPAVSMVPGESREFLVEGTNGANDPDALTLTASLHDFNRAGCDLANLGRLPEGSEPDCPYRAVPTAILAEWLQGAIPTQFGTLEAPLDPLGAGSGSFAIGVPATWAAMDDTTYTFSVTATSRRDPQSPPAANTFLAEQTVRATPESMTRYIGLEIDTLVAEIEEANDQGIATAGLHPILTHPIRMANQSALEAVLAGNASRAALSHRTTIHTTQAFLRALGGASGRVPEPYVADWKRRADAILADLNRALAG